MDTFRASEFLKAGRNIKLPFFLPLRNHAYALQCEELLRIVPGRRAVLLCKWGEQQVVAKLFFRPFQIRRHMKRELAGIEALTRAGITTARLLHSGYVRDESAGVLIFEYVQPAVHIEKLWEAEYSYEHRVELLRQVVIALARLHEKGLVQSDLHFKNFLLKGKTVYCIDGSAINTASKYGPVKISESLKNLALLFCPLATRESDLINDLFAVYANARGWQVADTAFARLGRYIELRQRQRIKVKSKKVLRNTSEVICKKSFSRFMVCKRVDYTAAMSTFLDNPDEMLDGSDVRLLKRGNTSTVARIKTDYLDCVVKRYNIKSFFHGLRKSFVESRASKSWRNAHLLLISGILTPKPIAFLEHRFGPLRGKAYFICEYVEGPRVGDFFMDGNLNDKHAVASQINAIFKRLALSKISHGDMKGSNIIIYGQRPVLLDLDAMRTHVSRRRFESAHREDIRRFFQNWLDAPEVSNLFTKLHKG